MYSSSRLEGDYQSQLDNCMLPHVSYFKRARMNYEQRNYEAAINNYDESIQLKPDYCEAYLHRGSAYWGIGKIEEAITDVSEALRLNPELAIGYTLRGKLHYSQKHLTCALNDFNKAMQLNPSDPQNYEYRGCIYRDLKNFLNAILDFNVAIELSPNRPVAYSYRGSIYMLRNNFTQALSDYSKAIELNPKYYRVHLNRGIIHRIIGNHPQAFSDYNEAISLSPTCGEIYYNRGILYYCQQNLTYALNDFNEAIRLNPNCESAYFGRALVFLHQNNYLQTINDCNKALRLKYADVKRLNSVRERAYRQLGGFSNIVSMYNEIIQKDPLDAEAYYNRGMAHQEWGGYFGLGDTVSALRDCIEAVKLTPLQIAAYISNPVIKKEFNSFALKKNEFDTLIDRWSWDKIKLVLEPSVAAQVYQRKQNHLVPLISRLEKWFPLSKDLCIMILSFLTDESYLHNIAKRVKTLDANIYKNSRRVTLWAQPNQPHNNDISASLATSSRSNPPARQSMA